MDPEGFGAWVHVTEGHKVSPIVDFSSRQLLVSHLLFHLIGGHFDRISCVCREPASTWRGWSAGARAGSATCPFGQAPLLTWYALLDVVDDVAWG